VSDLPPEIPNVTIRNLFFAVRASPLLKARVEEDTVGETLHSKECEWSHVPRVRSQPPTLITTICSDGDMANSCAKCGGTCARP
jgi:hypothetical protein